MTDSFEKLTVFQMPNQSVPTGSSTHQLAVFPRFFHAQPKEQDKQSSLDTAARNFLLGNSFQTLLFPDLTVSCYAKKVTCLSSVAERTISQYKYASEP